MLNLNKFGKNLKVTESLSMEFKNEKEMFIYIITLLEGCIERDDALTGGFGIDIYEYNNPLHDIIENLFLLHYGSEKTNIIMWYVYNRINEEGDLVPFFEYEQDKEDEDEEEGLILQTPEELYNYINKLK